ncbi:MAG TPA: tRNA (N(6)-L-threonylcarbamoyladenosine(37)-C(2))-methylthiotransferase MtaB, partial [Alphaproteobacteria bacterium]|nr:tRNA (N(6)-L-threonylcarbamoyladenosine(37)-C(2))-methylthiotransferase MtaB [Alphaproteobacteria bacterium]
HLRQDVIDVCNRARALRSDMVFGADIIAGFPTETEEMFLNTMKLVEECDLTFLHVFPYSPRPQTPAAKMPQVELAVRKERAARLRELAESQMARFLAARKDGFYRVVVEQGGIGRSEHFAEISLDRDYPVGSLVDVATHDVRDGRLVGKIAA